ncbi:hypothetical protein SARC_13591 [Sphaeroforma arctica JP610]|uniref:Uncharacterized protein n=1 Tax=Sphaeroforma arctica JP610 TaxID=667725 RepID=A0A0L0FBG6_9EUKA|nr:hypothetical protein SARC_13591 [Sphaeroforma arctica JP610]KNC73851.1 hypothetical protein SARC_13591 [Sphaeroforma arctica JP610]|eukprot:XP_014147753.1 hypothetical protein SARC_13591 [Sphaeroforma arctica JP610]
MYVCIVNIAQAIDVKNSNSIQSQPCSAQSGVNANGAEDSAYYTYTDGNQQRAADRETGTNSALVTPASGTNLTRVLPADTDYVEIVRGSRTANEVEDSHDDGYMSAVGTDADGSEEMSYAQFNRDMSDVPLQ